MSLYINCLLRTLNYNYEDSGWLFPVCYCWGICASSFYQYHTLMLLTIQLMASLCQLSPKVLIVKALAFSALTLLVGRQEGLPSCKKTEWWGAGVVICLERDADLHMAQLMPVPLTVSCFSKIQIGFTFLVPAHPGSPEQRAVKRVCVFWWWKKQKGLANPGLPGVEMAVKTVLMYCHASAPIL